MSGHGVLLSALPTQEDARRLGRLLVEENLAACVQLLPIQSFYRWDGKVQDENEVLLLIKTRTDLFDAAIARIKAEHPYTVPEIVGLPFSAGHQPYLDWIDASTAG